MYLDTALIAKFYVTEPESLRVRELVRNADVIYSSVWALAEFHAVLHRQFREGTLTRRDAGDVASRFAEHVAERLWNLLPVNEALLRRTGALVLAASRDIFIRTADAVHLTTAIEAGEREIWTNDRHMLAAARYFGLLGRSV